MNIAAIATAPGTGGIAVIRLSGPDAFTITDRIFRARNRNKTVSTAEAYTMLFGNIVDYNGQKTTVNRQQTSPDGDCRPLTIDCRHDIIDEVVISVFRARSEEHTSELQSHC